MENFQFKRDELRNIFRYGSDVVSVTDNCIETLQIISKERSRIAFVDLEWKFLIILQSSQH